MKRRVTVDVEHCLGCHTCELVCAVAHSQAGDLLAVLRSGERPGYRIHVETFGPSAVPVTCQHCEEPACAMACPTGAVRRLAPGKPVLVDAERCIGCSMCVQACPFGVIALNTEGKPAYKCDLCIRRQAEGQAPACVSSCPTRALHFVDEELTNRDKRRQAAARLAGAREAGAREEL